MQWVASTLHTTSEHGLSTITTSDALTSAASSRLNWRPHRFKSTFLFPRKTKYGFCACAITFQLGSNTYYVSVSFEKRCTWADMPLSPLWCCRNRKSVDAVAPDACGNVNSIFSVNGSSHRHFIFSLPSRIITLWPKCRNRHLREAVQPIWNNCESF